MKQTGRTLFLALGLTVIAFACFAAQAGGFRTTFFMIDKARWYISDGWANGEHQACEWRRDALSIKDNKLQLVLSDKGGKVRPIGCPEIRTQQRLGYGLYEARIRAAAGAGLNTAFFTYVGPPAKDSPHDEIDFEFLGKNPRTVDLNYFVGGKSMLAKSFDLGFDASADFHDYAFDWSPSGIKWFVDGKKIHETPPNTPLPSHPGQLFFSLWSGTKMMDAWMGPFRYKEPVTAEIAWVRFTPHK